MRCLTDVECAEWCKARGHKTRYEDVYGRFVPNVARAATDVSVAENAAESLESIELGKAVAAQLGAESETLIWVTDWEVNSDEGSLMSLLTDVRRSAGETRSLHDGWREWRMVEREAQAEMAERFRRWLER